MGKRKAPSSGDEMTKTTTASGNVSGEDTQTAAKLKEHREYLLAQLGMTLDDVDTPPIRKRKTAAKKSTKSDDIDTPTHFDSVALPVTATAEVKQSEDYLPTPGFATPQKKTKSKAKVASKAKKSKAAPTATTIEAEQAGPSSAHDSALSSDHDEICLKTRLLDGPEPQKRTRRTKTPTTKCKTPPTASKDRPEAEARAQSQPEPVSPSLKAKIRRVHDFIESGHLSNPLFLPNTTEDDPNIISIPSRNLSGVLKRLYIDYQLGDPETAHLAELELCISDRFTADVKECKDQNWMKVDFSLLHEVDILEEIMRKVRGCGLDGVNLLEVEMAMMERENLAQHGLLEEVEKNCVSAPEELQATLERTMKEVKSRMEVEEIHFSASDEQQAVLEKPMEEARTGDTELLKT